MDLIDSVNFQLSIQTLFFFSVMDRKTFKPSKNLIRINIGVILFFVSYALFWNFYYGKLKERNSNTVEAFSSVIASLCHISIMISTIFYRNKTSTFYSELLQVDKTLQMYGSLEETYQNFSVATKTIVLPILTQTCLVVALIKIYDIPLGFEELLPIVFYVFQKGSLIIYTFVFYFNIKLLRDRFRLVKDLTTNCYKMDEFENLERVHKNLIALMDGTTDTMGVKLGFVLVSNFLSAVITSYTVFVSFIAPSSENLTYYNIFGVILPNVIMLFMSFLSGEWITTDVSVKTCYFIFKLSKLFHTKKNRSRTHCMP